MNNLLIPDINELIENNRIENEYDVIMELEETIIDLFRNSSMRIALLFSSLNTSGLIIDSMSSILSSEIDKLEKDIKNLELLPGTIEKISERNQLIFIWKNI